MANTFDVWFVQADTVYKAVPFGVVTGWAEQGRLAGTDKVRPAGVQTAWVKVADHPMLADFLFVPGETTTAPATGDTAEQLQEIEIDAGWKKVIEDEDDDVDMIPLIDISLVLLIFFMMTATVAALSPVSVPEMAHAGPLGKDADAMTVDIDKRATGEVIYALRLGSQGPTPEDKNLPSVGDVINRLKARLSGVSRPPEVRIACNKELPRMHVLDVTKELQKLKDAKQIAFYGAEVNEAPK